MAEKLHLFTVDISAPSSSRRRGLTESLANFGVTLGPIDFDRIIDVQGELEQTGPYRTYREIKALSLVQTVARGLGLTCVFVKRPHHRAGPAEHRVHDIEELSTKLRALVG